MSYYYVESVLSINGELKVIVKIPLKFILPTLKYKYQLKARNIILDIVEKYFSQKNFIENIKKVAEEDFRERYGKDIKISKLILFDKKFSEEYIILEYNAKLIQSKKRFKDDEEKDNI